MTDPKDKHPLYRGPGQSRDGDRAPRPPRRDDRQGPRMPNRADRDALRTSRGDEPDRQEQMRPVKPKEFRIYGLNACIAAFKKRPESVRKLWLLESRIPKLQELLAFCVKNRIGYNVVENEDLEKLTGSAHHEGVCLALLPQPELNLSQWLMNAPAGGCLLLWLDGVGNPHNLGAIMRSAVCTNLVVSNTSYGARAPHENGATAFGGIVSNTFAPAPSTQPVVRRRPMPVFT